MTSFQHKVVRETVGAYNAAIPCHRRRIIVTLLNMDGEDLIELREERSHAKFYLPVDVALKNAIYRKAMSEPRKPRKHLVTRGKI